MNTLTLVLTIIQSAATVAASLGAVNPEVAAGGLAAEELTKIAQAALVAHQQIAGKPMDLSLLRDLPEVQ